MTVVVDEIRELSPVERIARLHAVDAELRRLEAEAAVLVAAVGDDGAFRVAGASDDLGVPAWRVALVTGNRSPRADSSPGSSIRCRW